jgi:hypothetical protein
MAVQEVRQLPAEYIEALGKTYADQLTKDVGGLRSIDLTKLYGPSFVAGPGALTTQAESLAGGLGSYAPFLQAAQAATGPTAYQQYMSPYQQDVIGTTLQEFDIQAQKGAQQVPAAAIAAGAFGGGREGVARSEYQATSDRNRAALQAQLLQQGFGQAQQLAATTICSTNEFSTTSSCISGSTDCRVKYIGCTTTSENTSRIRSTKTTCISTSVSTLSSNTSFRSRCDGINFRIPSTNTTNNYTFSVSINNCIRNSFNISWNL